jgi:hypothetical protein
MRSWRYTPVLVAIVLTVVPSLANAASHRVTIDNFGRFQVRPDVIPQGASNSFFDLDWKQWGGPVARAKGKGSYGITGHYHVYRLTLRADRIRSCRGRRVYGRLRIWKAHGKQPTIEELECRVGQYLPPAYLRNRAFEPVHRSR